LRTDEWRNAKQSIYVLCDKIIMYTVPELKFIFLDAISCLSYAETSSLSLVITLVKI
jgi:hypothetical protein